MRASWLSGRAIALHVGLLVWVPACTIAAWWQVNRAADGNELSYLYSVMWPVFGLLGIIFWWMLVHTDYDAVGLKGMRRQQAHAQTTETVMSHTSNGVAAIPASAPGLGDAATAGAEDPELAAYNARLAGLAAKGPKTWRHREEVVVRRPQ